MKYPQWTDPQFLDANGIGGLNAAAQTTLSGMADAGSAVWAVPGLVAPDKMNFGFTGLSFLSTLPAPAGIVTSGGMAVYAHGTQTGQDTDAYTTDFSSLVPSTGSIEAILTATPVLIQQDPFPIPGPPPGFPSYNPNYVPTIGYATNTYSLALGATTGAVDNVSMFELLRTTLVPGQTVIASYTTANQVRAAARGALPALTIASGGTLIPDQAFRMIVPAVPGLTFTLPSTSDVGGTIWPFSNPTSGALTIAAAGPDTINGYGAGSVSSIVVGPSGSASLWANGPLAQWQLIAGSPGLASGRIIQCGVNNVGAPSTIVFPTPFPNGCLSVVVSEGNANSGTWGAAQPTTHGSQSPAASGYIAWALKWDGATWISGSISQSYIAIGW